MKKINLLLLLTIFSNSALSTDKMVVDRDDRIQIKKRNKTQVHQSIGMIYYHNRNMTYFCSGTIIGPKLVLTAAHCVEPGMKIYFIPGQVSRIWRNISFSTPRNALLVKEAHQFPGYNKKESLTKDIAVLVFEKEFKARPLSLSTQYAANEVVTISGFPTDKPTGTMWEDSGQIDGASYTIDTFGGQSGSALRNERDEIIGVHSHAIYGQKKNFACLIKQEHMAFIEKFMN